MIAMGSAIISLPRSPCGSLANDPSCGEYDNGDCHERQLAAANRVGDIAEGGGERCQDAGGGEESPAQLVVLRRAGLPYRSRSTGPPSLLPHPLVRLANSSASAARRLTSPGRHVRRLSPTAPGAARTASKSRALTAFSTEDERSFPSPTL